MEDSFEVDGAGPRETTPAAKYWSLIADFIAERISADDFETAYLKLFKDDADLVAGREFTLLEGLFFDVDDYVGDPELRSRAGGLDGDQLRSRAREVYLKLYGPPVPPN
ncbi:colicin immunity domain-containing protein [Mycobacterium sp. OTB74]|uniref:colicin immunity domain-containing protein n=1 Tax=Mycobacterium sp. OTB74 TaxID=1853452 RepID=UPI0024744B3D|nr:colicin immunity domain-containing protein [Mycobacterium sp. OTB74]MDH6245492.1 hypothetical protein [Mycobacterium sp. OTB74]